FELRFDDEVTFGPDTPVIYITYVKGGQQSDGSQIKTQKIETPPPQADQITAVHQKLAELDSILHTSQVVQAQCLSDLEASLLNRRKKELGMRLYARRYNLANRKIERLSSRNISLANNPHPVWFRVSTPLHPVSYHATSFSGCSMMRELFFSVSSNITM
nr:TK upstream ORF 1 [Bovine gammaherpesvirus 4]